MPIRNILLAVLLLAAAPVSQALAKEEYKDAHIHEPAIPAGMPCSIISAWRGLATLLAKTPANFRPSR